MARSEYLDGLGKDDRKALEKRLLDRQSGKCFICEKSIDLVIHEGNLDVDHIDPLLEGGLDDENNFALTHAPCNRSKSASDLRVARRMAQFEQLHSDAKAKGARGANLGHLLEQYGGACAQLRLDRTDTRIRYALSEAGDPTIQDLPLYTDALSGMQYFFAVLPIEYLHHDDRINPRSIGENIRGLIEEFMKKRPQLHVSLGWWAPDAEGQGRVKVFDGQHKAAAQILLGVKRLPVRVFISPDVEVILQANTNAGGKLRQVAFDTAVMRHLGSTIFTDRVKTYQQMKGLPEDNYSFSEKDLVSFFKGEHREMLRYILDSARDAITYNQDNRLMEFVEWAGKGADRPLSYSSVEKTFFSEFLFKGALSSPIDEGMDRGDNSRMLERQQMVKLMALFAKVFFIGKWDPEVGGRRVENRLQKGETIPEDHLRAWRVAREEILAVLLQWVRLVIENYFAFTGQMVDKAQLFQVKYPDTLWLRIEAFLNSVAKLPCWIDRELSTTVFGAKQNRDFWIAVFRTGKSPTGVQVLAKPLDIATMIQE
jgi:hypothetical protein